VLKLFQQAAGMEIRITDGELQYGPDSYKILDIECKEIILGGVTK